MGIELNARAFINQLNNIKESQLQAGVNKLSQKERKFVLDCVEILKGKPIGELKLNGKNFKKISTEIFRKVTNEKAFDRNSSLIDKFLQAIGIRISNSRVVVNVKGQTLDNKSFAKLLTSFKDYKTAHPGEKVSFANFLRDYGYSTELKGINFGINSLTINQVKGHGVAPFWGTDLFKDVSFEGLSFSKCDFGNINFRNSQFKNCEFHHCNMKNTVFFQARLSDTSFSRCDFEESIFNNARLNNVQFSYSNMEYANFQQAKLQKTEFSHCPMIGTNFIEASVSKASKLRHCDLTNCLLFETKEAFRITGGKEHKITKPIVGIMWSLETPGLTATKLNRSLKSNDSIPLKYNYHPEGIKTDKLDREVNRRLSQIKKNPKPDALSIPAHLLELSKKEPEKNPQIAKLQAQAKNLLKHVDSLLLPGGADIQPEFYGQRKTTTDRHSLDPDYRRTILEFALLDEARTKGTPCMGICRGSQMGNIFYGGDLKQHVPGQTFSIQTYQAEPMNKSLGQGMLRGAMKGKPIKGVTMHHQANAKVGEDLEAVIVHKEKVVKQVGGKKVVETAFIPKALENKRGAPLILIQFHPEFKGDRGNWEGAFIDYKLSEANKDFFTGFIGAAKTYRKKKDVLDEIKNLQLNNFVALQKKENQRRELEELRKAGAVKGLTEDEDGGKKIRMVSSNLSIKPV